MATAGQTWYTVCMYYVYLLRCLDGSLYAGITTDLARRLREHRGAGDRGAKSTRAKGVVGYLAAWTAPDRAAAGRLEYRLKRMGHEEKEALAGRAPEGYVPVSKEMQKEAEA